MRRWVLPILLIFIVESTFLPITLEASLWVERRASYRGHQEQSEKFQEAFRFSPDSTQRSNLNFFIEDRMGLRIPQTLGEVTDYYFPENSFSPLVVHIQDAHGLYSAQRNAAEILNLLTQQRKQFQQGPLSVYVEGSWRPVYTGWLHAISDETHRKNVAQSLLLGSWITGEEYQGILSGPKEIHIKGVEEKEIFLENLNYRREVASVRNEIVQHLAGLKSRLKPIQERFLRGPEQVFLGMHERYHKKTLDLAEYVGFLRQQSDLDWAAQEFPQMAAFHELVQLEKRINLENILQERSRLIAALQKKIDAATEERLAEMSLAYQSGQIEESAFYETLIRLAELHQEKAEQIRYYLRLVKTRQKIQANPLRQEVLRAENALIQKYKNPGGKSAEVLEMTLALEVEQLFWAEKFSPSDWQQYKLEQGRFKVGSYRVSLLEKFISEYESELSGNWNQYKVAESEVATRAILEHFDAMYRYYDLAYHRDEVMSNNLLSELKKMPSVDQSQTQASSNKATHSQWVVFIAGGFHTEGILERLKKSNVGYVVVRPRLETDLLPNIKKVSLPDLGAIEKMRKQVLSDLKNYHSSVKDLQERRQLDRTIETLQTRLTFFNPRVENDFALLDGAFQGDDARTLFTLRFSPAMSDPGKADLAGFQKVAEDFAFSQRNWNDRLRDSSKLDSNVVPVALFNNGAKIELQNHRQVIAASAARESDQIASLVQKNIEAASESDRSRSGFLDWLAQTVQRQFARTHRPGNTQIGSKTMREIRQGLAETFPKLSIELAQVEEKLETLDNLKQLISGRENQDQFPILRSRNNQEEESARRKILEKFQEELAILEEMETSPVLQKIIAPFLKVWNGVIGFESAKAQSTLWHAEINLHSYRVRSFLEVPGAKELFSKRKLILEQNQNLSSMPQAWPNLSSEEQKTLNNFLSDSNQREILDYVLHLDSLDAAPALLHNFSSDWAIEAARKSSSYLASKYKEKIFLSRVLSVLIPAISFIVLLFMVPVLSDSPLISSIFVLGIPVLIRILLWYFLLYRPKRLDPAQIGDYLKVKWQSRNSFGSTVYGYREGKLITYGQLRENIVREALRLPQEDLIIESDSSFGSSKSSLIHSRTRERNDLIELETIASISKMDDLKSIGRLSPVGSRSSPVSFISEEKNSRGISELIEVINADKGDATSYEQHIRASLDGYDINPATVEQIIQLRREEIRYRQILISNIDRFVRPFTERGWISIANYFVASILVSLILFLVFSQEKNFFDVEVLFSLLGLSLSIVVELLLVVSYAKFQSKRNLIELYRQISGEQSKALKLKQEEEKKARQKALSNISPEALSALIIAFMPDHLLGLSSENIELLTPEEQKSINLDSMLRWDFDQLQAYDLDLAFSDAPVIKRMVMDLEIVPDVKLVRDEKNQVFLEINKRALGLMFSERGQQWLRVKISSQLKRDLLFSNLNRLTNLGNLMKEVALHPLDSSKQVVQRVSSTLEKVLVILNRNSAPFRSAEEKDKMNYLVFDLDNVPDFKKQEDLIKRQIQAAELLADSKKLQVYLVGRDYAYIKDYILGKEYKGSVIGVPTQNIFVSDLKGYANKNLNQSVQVNVISNQPGNWTSVNGYSGGLTWDELLQLREQKITDSQQVQHYWRQLTEVNKERYKKNNWVNFAADGVTPITILVPASGMLGASSAVTQKLHQHILMLVNA